MREQMQFTKYNVK